MMMSAQRIKSAAANRVAAMRQANLVRPRPVNDMMSEITRIAKLAINDANFIFAALVTAFVVLTHIDDLHDGPLGEFFDAHSNNRFVAWILKDIDKFFGLLIFIPSAAIAPKLVRSAAYTACAVGVIILPTVHVWSYLVASAGVMFFLNFRNPMHKLVLAATVSFYLYNDYKSKRDQNGGIPAPIPTYGDNSVPYANA